MERQYEAMFSKNDMSTNIGNYLLLCKVFYYNNLYQMVKVSPTDGVIVEIITGVNLFDVNMYVEVLQSYLDKQGCKWDINYNIIYDNKIYLINDGLRAQYTSQYNITTEFYRKAFTIMDVYHYNVQYEDKYKYLARHQDNDYSSRFLLTEEHPYINDFIETIGVGFIDLRDLSQENITDIIALIQRIEIKKYLKESYEIDMRQLPVFDLRRSKVQLNDETLDGYKSELYTIFGMIGESRGGLYFVRNDNKDFSFEIVYNFGNREINNEHIGFSVQADERPYKLFLLKKGIHFNRGEIDNIEVYKHTLRGY